MKSKSLIKSTSHGLVIMALLAMIACHLDIQEIRTVSELKLQPNTEIVSKIGDLDSRQASICYFTYFQNNNHKPLIPNSFYAHVLRYHNLINLQSLKNQKLIELSIDSKKSLLFNFFHIPFDTEYHEVIS
ncbi:MAG: hypothetical protein PF517_01205 [Salinivirgaceae bacterium]|jgi:hypothetical protein|nr:hypothetical protein [Salinivirgaceae bacterium]